MTTQLAPPRGGSLQSILDTGRRDRWLVACAVLIACSPIVVATARAVRGGWLAVGDNADFLIRARDVLTTHHPLLGTWTSASLSLGVNVDNPGPLLFDLFAVPAKLGGSAGLAIAVALIGCASIAGIAWFGYRVGGTRFGVAGCAAAAVLIWSMGSELLFDPWQPHSLLLPFLLLLVLVVAMARGDRLALPIAAGVASLIVQTHLSYAVLVPVVCLWGLWWLWRDQRRAVTRPAIVAAAVLAACWAQPLIDQVAGEGNLGQLATHASSPGPKVGTSVGTRVVADVLTAPPWSARRSFERAVLPPRGQPPLIHGEPNIGGLPSNRAAGVALAASALVLVAAWLVARRRGDRLGRTAVATVGLALALAVLVTAQIPIGKLGLAPHQVRYLWPVYALAVTVVVAVVAPRRWVTAVLTVAMTALAVLNMPFHEGGSGPSADADAIPIVRAIDRQLGLLDTSSSYLYDTRGLRFAEPWTSSVMAGLQDRGIDFVVDDDGWVGQLGPARRAGKRVIQRLFVREGELARTVPAGARRVAFVDGLSMGERAELARLERRLVDVPVRLNRVGRAAREAGGLPSFASVTPTAEQLLSTGELSALVRLRLIDIPAARSRDLDHYARLRFRADRHTVAVFVAPR